MEEVEELKYWTRRLERRVFLLLFTGSLAFLLSRLVSLDSYSRGLLFCDIANVLIAVLQSQCVVIMLGLMLPICTKTVFRQGFWVFAISFAWVYVRVHILKWHGHSHESLFILGSILMLPVWLLLWLRAQYREFFRDILFQVSRHIKGITAMDFSVFGGTDKLEPATKDRPMADSYNGSERIIQNFGRMVDQTTSKRNRMVGLLGLILSGRFLLSMLSTIGLNGADIVKLKDYHQKFCEKVLEAKTKYLERKEAYRRLQKRMGQGQSESNLLPKQGLQKSMASIDEQLEKRTFEYDVNILVDAAVVFMAQTLSLLLARLHRHTITRLDIFAGQVLQNVISNPTTQRRWRKLMSSTQYLVTKKALDRIENIVVPFPEQIEPKNVLRLIGNIVLVEILQRNFFQSISRYWVESNSTRTFFNRCTRAFMWTYVITRFGINMGRSLIDDAKRTKESGHPLPSNVDVGYNGYEFLDRFERKDAVVEEALEPEMPLHKVDKTDGMKSPGGDVDGDHHNRNRTAKSLLKLPETLPKRALSMQSPTNRNSTSQARSGGSGHSRLIHA